jgi:hypothetical protein
MRPSRSRSESIPPTPACRAASTCAERINYDTSTLLFDTFWYQTDDLAPAAPKGYYNWYTGQWQYLGTDLARVAQVINGGLAVFNGGIYIRRDDAEANLILVGGRGSTYQGTSLYFADDNLTRKLRWNISKGGDATADLYFGRFDDAGNFVDIPFYISRQFGTVTIGKRLDAQYILDAQAKFYLSGDITPAQITADQNDYAPASLDVASTLRLSSDAARNLTGLTGGVDGRLMILVNIGAFAITLKNASASSSAENRFQLKADLPLAANGSAVLRYAVTVSKWMCVGAY